MFVPAVKPMSYASIEIEAQSKLTELFPDRDLTDLEPIDVLETWELLSEKFEFQTSVCDLPPGVEGRTWPDGRVQLSSETYAGVVMNEGRPRFTTIHECMHAWYHSKQISDVLESGSLTLNRRKDIPAYKDPEWQANALTGAFLMPRDAIVEMQKVRGYLDHNDLQECFNVSYTAALTRLSVLRKQGVIK